MRWSLLLLAGCLPDPGGELELRGRHLVVHVDPEIPVCADAIAIADRFVEDTAAMLGVEPPTVHYYLINGPTGCGTGQYTGASCTAGGTVYSNSWIHYHELVHAVDDSNPPALFVEGLAEALSTPSGDARRAGISRADVRLDIESSAFRTGPPGDEYATAGDFVRYLVERFGAARYRSFARSTLSLSDQISTRRTFERVFHESLDDVIAEWRVADATTSTLVVPVDAVECTDPIAPVAEESWGVDEVIPDGCHSGTTVEGTSYTQHSDRYGFEVTWPGVFVVESATSLGDLRAHVRTCGGVPAVYDYWASGTAKRFTTVPLAAGRHAIELAPGATAWSVRRLGDLGTTCETAPRFTAPRDEPWELDIRDDPATWIQIQYDGPSELYASAGIVSQARVCTGSCASLTCTPVVFGTPIARIPGQPLYLSLGAGSRAATVVVKTTD